MKRIEMMKSFFASTLITLSACLSAQTTPDISLVFYLDENSLAGTLVGAVSATDPDGDELSYSITSGNDEGAFSIANTGNMAGTISVANGDLLDFETTPVFELMVEANDGNGGVTTASVTINLIDIDENVLGIVGDLGLSVYPNPTTDYVIVDIGSNSAIGKSQISVFDVKGNQVMREVFIDVANKTVLDFRNFTNGIYHIRIEVLDQDLISTHLIMKN